MYNKIENVTKLDTINFSSHDTNLFHKNNYFLQYIYKIYYIVLIIVLQYIII